MTVTVREAEVVKGATEFEVFDNMRFCESRSVRAIFPDGSEFYVSLNGLEHDCRIGFEVRTGDDAEEDPGILTLAQQAEARLCGRDENGAAPTSEDKMILRECERLLREAWKK